MEVEEEGGGSRRLEGAGGGSMHEGSIAALATILMLVGGLSKLAEMSSTRNGENLADAKTHKWLVQVLEFFKSSTTA